MPITAYKPSPNHSFSSLIRYLTLRLVSPMHQAKKNLCTVEYTTTSLSWPMWLNTELRCNVVVHVVLVASFVLHMFLLGWVDMVMCWKEMTITWRGELWRWSYQGKWRRSSNKGHGHGERWYKESRTEGGRCKESVRGAGGRQSTVFTLKGNKSKDEEWVA